MLIAVVAASLLLGSVTLAASGSGPNAVAIERLKAKAGVGLLEETSSGRVRFVMGQLSAPIRAGREIEATLEFLNDHRAAYGIRNPVDELKVERLDLDQLGMKHVRMKQLYRGLPVYGGQLISHINTDGILRAVNGTFVEGLKLDPTPQVGAAQALDVATADLESFFGAGRPDDAELVVFPWEGTNYLAWRTVLWSDSPMGRWEYFVDAKTGEVIFKANRIMDSDAIGTGIGVMGDARTHIDTDYDGSQYQMIDATRQAGNDPHGHGGQMLPGSVIRTHVADPNIPGALATDADNDWSGAGQAASVDGQFWAAKVYDWMLDVWGRNSFDDAGSTMRTTVDYSLEGDNNAYWQGSQIVIWSWSSGWRSLAGCPDVIAHEWGHAVTDYTSDLVYQKESGALNESFSDMMGAAFEFAHASLDSPDWLMGENGRTTGSGFRDMSNPPAKGDPDTYQGAYWVNVDGCTPSNDNDQCGVHTNSGVGNKWFYLLSDGGSHNGVSVTGIGVENAMVVAYHANRFYWTEFSTYSEAAYGTVTAADDLDGTGVWTQSVRDAWEAVGVDMPAPSLVFNYPVGQPSLLVPNEATTFTVDVTATYEGSVVAGSGNLSYRLNGGSIVSTPMTDLAPGSFEATLPALNCGQQIEYRAEASEATEGVFIDPAGWRLAAPGTVQSVIFEDDFETDKGWSAVSDWSRGAPTGGGGQYGGPDPVGAHSGSYEYGYNLSGDYPNDLSPRNLTSPAFDCSGMNNIHVEFYRWLGVEQPAYDHAYIRVSNNGSSWTTVWENDIEYADTEWTLMDVDISSVASGEPTVYVRFVMGSTDGGWQYCGWNIDDLQVTGYECGAPGDADLDGILDGSDNCPEDYNPLQEDDDGDLVGNPCDQCVGYDDAVDTDEDTVPDGCDICAGYDDATDIDHDDVPDGCDNCLMGYNPGQEDGDGDLVGDICDNCIGAANLDQDDTDGDDVGDACDQCEGFDDADDADEDTVPDGCDLCADHDDLADADGDAWPDDCDNCPQRANPGQEDVTNDGIGDVCCCSGRVGDANGIGGDEPTIGDISAIIDNLFIGMTPLPCYQEADINQSGGITAGPDDVSIGDISILVDYLFITGPSLGVADCL
jgi:thermolysin